MVRSSDGRVADPAGEAAARQLEVPEAGDPACWAARVCPDCGRLAEEERPLRCPSCGAAFDS